MVCDGGDSDHLSSLIVYSKSSVAIIQKSTKNQNFHKRDNKLFVDFSKIGEIIEIVYIGERYTVLTSTGIYRFDEEISKFEVSTDLEGIQLSQIISESILAVYCLKNGSTPLLLTLDFQEGSSITAKSVCRLPDQISSLWYSNIRTR